MGLNPGMAFLAGVRRYVERKGFPSGSAFRALVEKCRLILETEPRTLRPADHRGRPGGLLLLPDLPTVILPDIHARPAFLLDALAWRPPLDPEKVPEGRDASGPRLVELLGRGEALLVCLGDALHSEAGSARERWARAYREYLSGWESHAAMDEEMRLGLGALWLILEAMVAFPRHFHYLKGNHDNLANEEGAGDHPFYKFADEGEMGASWFVRRYGGELLRLYRGLELSLPLLAVGGRFVASHAEPAFALGAEDVIEYRSRPEVVEALTWTANGAAETGSVRRSLAALLGEAAQGARWFSGHRPVEGDYTLRAEGLLVQFHTPGASRLVFLRPGAEPDPDRAIVNLRAGSVAGEPS